MLPMTRDPVTHTLFQRRICGTVGLAVLVALYLLVGLTVHDPWRGDDARYFGPVLATLRGELQAFRGEYYRRLGVLYQYKDRLSALVARLLASLEPENADRQAQALDAQSQAQATEQEMEQEFNNGNSEPAPFAPSAELKAAYRQAAKIMHPDRANNDEDRAYRTEMIAKVNVAYEAMTIEASAQ